MGKSPDAFRTITEVAEWLDTPAHVLRFWESRFSQIKPIKRAGGRRYYRPTDMLLLGGIKKLLHDDGTTIKGAQKLLREKGIKHVQALSQPVSLQVILKKKTENTVKDKIKTAPVTPASTEPVSPPAMQIPVDKTTKIKDNPIDSEDDQGLLDLPVQASANEANLIVLELPKTLKSAQDIPPKDMQDIEALYYSLKMVRNNMKRTGAGR